MSNPPHDRLRSHFAALPGSSYTSGWDTLWKEGTFVPWDRGLPNPALSDFLAHPTSPPLSPHPNPTPGAPPQGTIAGPGISALPPPLREDGTRRKALVPGCGKGYDVALLASWGFDAYGLEISPTAADKANEYLASNDGGAMEGEYQVKDEGVGRGGMVCLRGDYFEDAWLGDAGAGEEGFDIIYDNTFLCALPPTFRSPWALRTTQLLSPTGTLICLEFPTHKPAASQGPPWSLPPTVHLELLKRPGEDVVYDKDGVVVETQREEAGNALKRVAHWVPGRTHGVGVVQGVVRDCVSLWRH